MAKGRAEVVEVVKKEQAARATSPAMMAEEMARKAAAADTAVKEVAKRREGQGNQASWEVKLVAEAG